MGTFFGDFSAELARWEKTYAGRPRDELLKLAFLSLEREQLVSVTYHDDLLSQRLAALPIDDDARALIRHALAFTWKDEEMHAVYIRGLLWREGTFGVRARANLHFVTGLIAGWATFVQQHVKWREAPVSRAISTATLWGGLLTGTAPPSVRQHLRYHSFRDFCAFNVDAEKTATLSWSRLAELGRQTGLEPETIALFERVRDDEIQHERLFEVLADALTDDDHLKPGVDADVLAKRIGAVNPDFLPRRYQLESARSPLGSGGIVAMIEGDDRDAALGQALSAAGLTRMLEERARLLGKPVAALTVAVKTSFMLGTHEEDRSTIVSPVSIAAIANHLHSCGISDVAVLDAPTLYDRFHTHRTVAEVAAYFHVEGAFRLVDASVDQVPANLPRGMVPATISRTWRDADVRLVLGKLRSHPVNGAMLGLSTLEGLGARADAFQFADRAAAPEVAVVALASSYPLHFSVIDGWDDCPDGLAGMLGTTTPKAPHRWYAGADALAVDLVAAKHVGVPEPFASKQLRTAMHWFGDPRAQTELSGRDVPVPGWRAPYRFGFATTLRFLAAFVFAHASGRGALFVPSMDERAFPPITPPGLALRVGRWLMRRIFGLPS